MKKLYISTLFLIALTVSQSYAQTAISVSQVPSTLCSNEQLTIPIVMSSGFSSGNVVTIQLSDAAGLFTGGETNIGALATNAQGGHNVDVQLPPGITFSNLYQIRAVTSSPSNLSAPVVVNVNCITRDYYWVGGSGNWSDFSNHWATASNGSTFHTEAPTLNDNVYFDGFSFPSGGQVTLDNNSYCNDFNWLDASTSPTIGGYNYLYVRGNYLLQPGMSRNYYLQLQSNKPNVQIDFGAGNLNDGYVYFRGTGSYILFSELSTYRLYFYDQAQLFTNDYNITVIDQLYGSNNAIQLYTGASEMRVGYLRSNGMFIVGSSHWYFSNSSTSPRYLGDNLTFEQVTIESGKYNLYGNLNISSLNINPGVEIYLQDGTTLTVNNSLQALGQRDQMISIASQNPGLQGTLATAGASINLDYVRLQDNILNNGGSAYAPSNVLDDGNNSGDWNLVNQIQPLTFYWIGGSGDWSDYSSHWAILSGGGGFHDSAPGPLDNIVFDSNSFPSGGNLEINSDIEFNSMTWEPGSADNGPVFDANYNRITVHGDFILTDGIQRRFDQIFFESDGARVINFADNLGRYYATLYFQGGGTWDLQSDLEVGSLFFYDATFNSNSNSIDIDNLYIYDDLSVTNWSGSIVDLRYLNKSAAGATFNAGNSSFVFSDDYSNTINGTTTFNSVTLQSDTYISSDNVYNELIIEPGVTLTLVNGTNQTFIDSFVANGLRPLPITIKSNSVGNSATITSATAGTINTEYLILQDNTAAGATFNTDFSINNGNVTGWNFGSPLLATDFYWVGDGGDWLDYQNHWALQANGSTGFHSSAPGPIDNVFFTSNSFTQSGQTVTISHQAKMNDMTWQTGSGTNNPTINADYNNFLTVSGNLTFDNGVNRNIRRIYLESANTNQINLADNSGDALNTYIYFRGTGTWDIVSDVEAGGFSLEDATVNTNNNTISVFDLGLNYGTSIFNAGSSTVYAHYVYGGGILNPGSSNFVIEDYGYISLYGSASFDGLVLAAESQVQIYDNITINEFTLGPGSLLQIGNGTTVTTTGFTAVGENYRPILIQSTGSGSQGILSQAAGSVNGEYLIISDNQATGGAVFNAINSIDGGNISGWNITAPVPQDYYWIGGEGNWSDINHWSDTEGGAPAYSVPPGLADNVYFSDNSFSAANQAVTLDYSKTYVDNMYWFTSPATAPIVHGERLSLFGTLEFADGVQRDIDQFIFEAPSGATADVNFADNTVLTQNASLRFIGKGEWSIQSDIEASSISIQGGIIHFGSNNIRASYLQCYNNNSVPIALNFNSSTFNINELYISNNGNNVSFNAGTSVINLMDISGYDSYFSSYSGSPFNFNILNIENDSRIYGNNSFNEFNVGAGFKVRLGNNYTQTTQSLSLNGTATDLIEIESTSEGQEAFFSVPPAGTVSADYVIFKDNHAGGGATFTATNSSQLSNVQGWSGLKEGQTITFPDLDDLIFQSSRELNATASSALTVTYELLPVTGTGAINGSTYQSNSDGLVGIRAVQSGDGTFGPAKPVVQFVYSGVGQEINALGQMKQPIYVVGAPNRVTRGDNNPSQTSVTYPQQAIVSSDGRLIVASEARVLIWNQLPDAYNVPADVVVGQPTFDEVNYSTSQSTLNSYQTTVAVGPQGQLIVGDGRRVLIWNSIPTSNGAPADVVVGQNSFTSSEQAVTQDRFAFVSSVAVSPSGKLLVSDRGAHRVLIFNSIPTTNGAAADVVIGQPDFTSSNSGSGSNQLYGPFQMAITGDEKLLIADAYNHRVLVFNSIPTSNNADADMVIGQSGFGSSSQGTENNKLYYPQGVAISRSGKVAIADSENNRVLIYNQIPTSGDTPADIVLGQPIFTSREYDYDIVTSRNTGYPSSVFWDQSENFFIVDRGGRRVLVYGEKDLQPPLLQVAAAPSEHTLGQPTVITVQANDRSGLAKVQLEFKEITQMNPLEVDSYNTIDFTDDGNGNYSIDLQSIESSAQNPMGFVLFLYSMDNLGNDMNTVADKVMIPIRYGNGVNLSTFGTGSNTSDYRIFTVPLNLDNPNVVSVFDGILGGTYDDTKLRIFQYPGGTSTSYNEFNQGGFSDLEMGVGYFGLSASTGSENTGAGTTSFMSETLDPSPNERTLHYVPLNLVDGWNLIGNPLLNGLDWSLVLQSNGLSAADVSAPEWYNGTTYETVDVLSAGVGAFVRNNTGGPIQIKVPTYNTSNGRKKSREDLVNPLTADHWEIRLLIKDVNSGLVKIGGLGMAPTAITAFDEFDVPAPPTFGEMISLSFHSPEQQSFKLKKDIRGLSEKESWSFVFNRATDATIEETLAWDNSYFGNDAPPIFLVDKTHFQVIDMREQDSYTFKHSNKTEFEVYFGELAISALLPEDVSIERPYPNPFRFETQFNVALPASTANYNVSLRIFNSQGQLVHTESQSDVRQGYHSVSWDGKNRDGVELAPGIYAYTVQVSGETSFSGTGHLVKK